MFIEYMESFIGTIAIRADEDFLVSISLCKQIQNPKPNRLTKKTQIWLQSYFAKDVLLSSLPLQPAKTDFIITKKVVIDTTGPEIKFNEVKNTLNVSVKDALSTIYGAEYRFSDEKMWRKILPVDGISDEKEETYEIKLQPNENR